MAVSASSSGTESAPLTPRRVKVRVSICGVCSFI